MQTIETRLWYLQPIFFTQPLLLGLCSFAGIMPKGKFMRLITDLTFISLGLWWAVPVAAAVYPQYPAIDVSNLESDIQEKVGNKHKFLLYNKGI
jgi:hypothetical protein